MRHVLRHLGWLPALCALAACAADAPKMTLRLYAEDDLPRQVYQRSESLPVLIRLEHPAGTDGGRVTVRLQEGARVPAERQVAVPQTEEPASQLRLDFPLAAFRRGEYTVQARWGDGVGAASAPVRICEPLDRGGLVVGMWWERAYLRQNTAETVAEFKSLGCNAIQVMPVYPELLDECLWQGLQCLSISHGQPKGQYATGERLTAAGTPYMLGGKPRWSIANTAWQRSVAENLGEQIARYDRHPAYTPFVCTSDDYFMWTGLDYHPENVRRFRELTGLEAPRPPAAVDAPFPLVIDRPKGIIPDDDPWVLWMRFFCRDVLGHYNRQLTEAVLGATADRGRIGPLCGGGLEDVMGFVPYVDVLSGQWPPYNFGDNGFNLLSCYNYNFYRYPALTQVWWYELGRMGNRGLPQWLMPETMDKRLMTHLQNYYLYRAAAQDGLVYFIYERSSPGALEALRGLAPVNRRYGKLLAAVKPAPRPVGLLMPFEQACLRTQYPVDAQYAFCNLLMAGVECEPVTPDEIAEAASPYRVIILHDIDWLTERSRDILRAFIRRGGTVLCDALTEVEIAGAVRLAFALATPDRRTGYGQVAEIARIRETLDRYGQPWASSADPHWLLRRFRLDGVDYLWVVNLMTREEDLAHVPERGRERLAEALPADRGLESTARATAVRIAIPAAAVYDVLNGRRLPSVSRGGVTEVTVETNAWQGALLACYPAALERIELRVPRQPRAGKPCDVRIRVPAKNRPAAATIPLELELFDPRGNRYDPYCRTALARRGECRLTLPFAVNDPPGRYRLRVTAADSGLSAEVTLDLHAP